MQTFVCPELSIGDAISGFLAAHGQLSFVQVGGFDGVSFDPLRAHIVTRNMSGVIIEPMPTYFAKLNELYARSDCVQVCNCAVDISAGERTMWRFIPAAVEQGIIGPGYAGMSSFLMHNLLKDGGTFGAAFDDNARTLLRSLVEPVTVRCETLENVLAEFAITRVDLLQVDTEGYDFEILKLFDFCRFRPAIVHYESAHLSAEDRAAAENLLADLGYQIHSGKYDTLAVRGVFLMAPAFDPAALLALAASLQADGRSANALTLYQHILSIEPENRQALAASMRILGASGQIKAALQSLMTLKQLSGDSIAMRQDVQEQVCLAIGKYNEHLSAGETGQAAEYITAMVMLLPGNKLLLQHAVEISQKLGQRDRIAEYAAELLVLDPTSFAANRELAVLPGPATTGPK